MVTSYTFNRHAVAVGEALDLDYTPRDIEGCLNFRRASMGDAIALGGPLIRRALGACPLRGDRPHILVDTKVSMLMPGWFPAIPGWHTDGVPRDNRGGYLKGRPSMARQQELSEDGESPIFHLMVLGVPNTPRFLADALDVPLANGENRRLYNELTDYVNEQDRSVLNSVGFTTDQWLTWDWWNIHTAQPSENRGWRLLIRVTESDIPPSDPAKTDIIRRQTMVYSPINFGW